MPMSPPTAARSGPTPTTRSCGCLATEDGDDRRRLRGLADRVTDIVTGFDELGIAERQERIERELAQLSRRRESP